MVPSPQKTRRSWPLVGASATFVANSVGYWLPGLGLPRLDFATLNGNLMVPELAAASFSWAVGALQTYALGALMAVVYGRYVRARLPGNGAVRGMLWGAVLMLFSGLTAFPLLFGAGFFGMTWHAAMPASLLLWHLTWGLTLGLIDEG